MTLGTGHIAAVKYSGLQVTYLLSLSFCVVEFRWQLLRRKSGCQANLDAGVLVDFVVRSAI